MKKLRIDPGCITCGLCEFLAPEIFQVTDISHVKANAPVCAFKNEIEQAIANCPVAVIKFDDKKEEI